jgi:hypothetical protein
MSRELVKKEHFHLGVLGRTGSGKTQWLKAFLRDKANVNVFVFCSEMSIGSWREFRKHNPQVRKVSSEIEQALALKRKLIKLKKAKSELPVTFMVFDDFMPILKHADAKQVKDLEEIAKIGRHLKIRIIALAQDAVDCPKYLRTQFTHVGIMKGTDGETFDQVMGMLKLGDYSGKLWKDLTKAEDHSMMLMEKGSNRGVFEKAEDGGIVTNIQVRGNNNDVKVLNVQGKSSIDARRMEIVNNRLIAIEQSRNRELDDAIERAKNIRSVFEGTHITDTFINKCEHNVSMLCSFLKKDVIGKDWVARAGFTLFQWMEYLREMEGRPMSYDEKKSEGEKILRQIGKRRDELQEKLAVSYATTGQVERAAAHLVSKKVGVDQVMGMPLDRALDVGKVALGLLKKFSG